jgi:hypothetical protein
MCHNVAEAILKFPYFRIFYRNSSELPVLELAVALTPIPLSAEFLGYPGAASVPAVANSLFDTCKLLVINGPATNREG